MTRLLQGNKSLSKKHSLHGLFCSYSLLGKVHGILNASSKICSFRYAQYIYLSFTLSLSLFSHFCPSLGKVRYQWRREETVGTVSRLKPFAKDSSDSKTKLFSSWEAVGYHFGPQNKREKHDSPKWFSPTYLYFLIFYFLFGLSFILSFIFFIASREKIQNKSRNQKEVTIVSIAARPFLRYHFVNRFERRSNPRLQNAEENSLCDYKILTFPSPGRVWFLNLLSLAGARERWDRILSRETICISTGGSIRLGQPKHDSRRSIERVRFD